MCSSHSKSQQILIFENIAKQFQNEKVFNFHKDESTKKSKYLRTTDSFLCMVFHVM